MIEHRTFNQLPSEDLGWLKSRRHIRAAGHAGSPPLGCLRAWNDEEIAPNSGFGLEAHANVEIITYVREGTLTHRDSLGNEGRVEAGHVQVVSAGVRIRHAEYNLEQVPTRIFQIWLEPASLNGSPAWGVQPCQAAVHRGCFVVLASGIDDDRDALPIRARARLLNAKLKVGDIVEYAFDEPRLAYLVPSSGMVEVNGIRICERDGAAISGESLLKVAAIEDADIFMIDFLSADSQKII
jgi:redox-sensitive bicupin YhaK (pirin superfamily)